MDIYLVRDVESYRRCDGLHLKSLKKKEVFWSVSCIACFCWSCTKTNKTISKLIIPFILIRETVTHVYAFSLTIRSFIFGLHLVSEMQQKISLYIFYFAVAMYGFCFVTTN